MPLLVTLISTVAIQTELLGSIGIWGVLSFAAIVPAIESDYKKLTTSEDQRKSYRAHIIRAAIDVLLAADAKFSAEEDVEGSISPEEIPSGVKKELPPEATENLQEQEDKEGIENALKKGQWTK